jgi:hypothetical protein
MPKRRLAEDGFEAHKDAILKLYKEEHQPISVTIEAMARQGFRRRYVYGVDVDPEY